MSRNVRMIVALFLGLSVPVLPAPAAAVGFDVPVLLQITRNTTGTIEDPRVRSEPPQRIVFTSDGDVTGPAPGRREIYEWDLDSRSMRRITNSGPYESYAGSRSTDITQTSRPEYVAFVSTADLDPTVGNADHNPEIFLWVRSTGQFRQVTDTQPPVENKDPYPSDSGRCIVFTSTGDINTNDGSVDSGTPALGYSNADGSQEVFLVQIDTDVRVEPLTFTQLTNGPPGTTSARPVIGGFYYPRQCNATAYMSDHLQVPEGNPGTQIYRFTRSAAATEVLDAREIPFEGRRPPAGTYLQPAMSSASNFARGPFIVFHTSADVWNNGSTNFNIFRYRTFHPRMTQYTDLSGDRHARNAAVSDGGRWIAFESNADMIRKGIGDAAAPFNADGNWEIFRMQKLRKVRQITDSQNCTNDQVTINDKGMNLAFRSTCELIPGLNPTGTPQVFMYLQVKGDDPLAGAAACLVSAGCCNEANGCYRSLEGATYKVRKKNCLANPRGCG